MLHACASKRFALVALLFAGTSLSAWSQTPVEKSWPILEKSLQGKKEEKIDALKALGVIPNNGHAAQLAITSLTDKDEEVRAAAANAIGKMQAKSAADMLADYMQTEKEPQVLLAEGHALLLLGDERGYSLFYAVLTGQQKSGGSLMDEQKKMLQDPKKMAQFGFEQGIGFIPFAGLGWGAIKQLTKDDVSPVRAGAATVLAKDPDPKSEQALVQASGDKSEIVQIAALHALAERNNPAIVEKILPWLSDDKNSVRCMAAGAIIHLSDTTKPAPSTPEKKSSKSKKKK